MTLRMNRGDSCLYKLKANCTAPAFKFSHGYQNFFDIQYLEFNPQDIVSNYTIEFNSKLREKWASDYPLKQITSPRKDDPVRNQYFTVDHYETSHVRGINDQKDHTHVIRPVKGAYNMT